MAAPIRVGGGYIEIVPKLTSDFKSKINAQLRSASVAVGEQAGKTIGLAMAGKSTNIFIAEMRSSSGQFRTLGAVLGAEVSTGIAKGLKANVAVIDRAMADLTKSFVNKMPAGLVELNKELLKTRQEMEKTAQAELALQSETKRVTSSMNEMRAASLQLRRSVTDLDSATVKAGTAQTYLARSQVSAYSNLQGKLLQLEIEEEKTLRKTLGLSDGFEKSTVSIGKFGRSLNTVGTALTHFVTVPLLAAGALAVKTGVEFTDLKNRTTAAIAAFQGQSAATGIVKDITELSTKMPVAVEDMLQLAQRLAALKTNAAPATAEVEAFTRAIAAHHLTQQQANRAMIQFQHIVMGYNVNARELNTLTMDGIPAWDLLSRAMGKSVETLKEMSKSGDLLSSDVTPKLVKFLNTNKEYQDSIKASGESLQGAWIRLKNIFKTGIANAGNEKAVSGLAKAVNDFGTALQNNMDSIQQFVTLVTKMATQVVNEVGKIMTWFNQLPDGTKNAITHLLAMAIVVGPLMKIGSSVIHVGTSVKNLATFAKKGGRELGLFGKVANTAFGFLKYSTGLRTFSTIFKTIGTSIKDSKPILNLVSGFEKLVGKIPGLSRLVPLITRISGGVGALVELGGGPLALITAALVAVGLAIWGAWKRSEDLRNSVKGLWTALKTLWTTVSSTIKPMFEYMKTSFTSTGNGTDSMGNKLQTFGDKFAIVVNKLKDGINWLSNNWGTFATAFVLGFQNWVSIIAGEVTPIVESLWSILKALFGAIWNIGAALGGVVGSWFNFSGGADQAQASIGGVAIAGGTLGKVLVYIVTGFQFMGQSMVATLDIVNVAAQAFAGLINILGSLGGAIVSIFTFDPQKISDAFSKIPSTLSSSFKQISSATSQAGGALGKLFDVNKMLKDNASKFNEIYAGLNNALKTSHDTKKPTKSSTTGSSNGGGSNDPTGTNSAADKAKKAAQAAAQKLKDARQTITNALQSFAGSITGSASDIKSATDSLSKTVESSMDSLGRSATGDKLVSYLSGVNKKLQALANQRDVIIKQINDAQDYSTTVTGSAQDSASLTNLPYSTTTANGIALGLQQRLAKIKQFVSVIKSLSKLGLAKGLLKQVVDAGPIDGLALAQALLAADKTTFATINNTQKQIDKSASELGSTASEMIFGSISALQKKGKSLQDQMNKIAKDAITKVATAFGIGWSDIKKITSNGMNATNAVLTTSLVKTTSSVGSAASVNSSNWAAMVANMNKSTSSLVNVTYGKGVAGVVSAMASLAGVKDPLPTLHFSGGGVIPGYAPRVDSVPIMASPGEGIMTPELTRQLGPARLESWNKMAMRGRNVFSTGGVVDGAAWVKQHQNDPYSGYDEALTAGLKDVVDPSINTLAKMAGAFSGLEGKDTQKEYPALHKWTADLDKRAGFGGSGSALVKLALNEEKSHPGDYNKYNHNTGQDWCAYFLSWLVQKTGTKKAYWNMKSWFPGWPAVAQWSAAGRGDSIPPSQAQAGDVAVWGGGAHVNLVMKRQNGGLLTIGGNQSDTISHYVRYGPPDRVMRPHWGSVPDLNGDFVNPWPGALISEDAGGPDGHGGAGGGTPSQNRALGRTYLNDKNQGKYYPAVDYIFTRESGWNQFAKNPSSGAYGIPQSLPGSKMASAGSDWRTNPLTQIRWGVNYMWDRYGNPNKAENFWKSHHWYKDGAWSIPETQPAVVHKGEMIIPTQQAQPFRDVISSKEFKARTNRGPTYQFGDIYATDGEAVEKKIRKEFDKIHTLYGGRS